MDQALDWLSGQQVRVDDLRNILGLDVGVPNPVRIDQHGGPDVAESHTGTIRAHKVALERLFPEQAAAFQLLDKPGFDRGGSVSRAGLAVADEDMFFEWDQILAYDDLLLSDIFSVSRLAARSAKEKILLPKLRVLVTFVRNGCGHARLVAHKESRPRG